MIRATTPKHTFIFEQDPEDVFDKILITYAQNDKIIMEKTKDDLEYGTTEDCDGNTVYTASVRLTQDETKRFSSKPRNMVDIQVRVLTYEGEALASDKKSISVLDVLDDEVLA